MMVMTMIMILMIMMTMIMFLIVCAEGGEREAADKEDGKGDLGKKHMRMRMMVRMRMVARMSMVRRKRMVMMMIMFSGITYFMESLHCNAIELLGL